MMNMAGIYRIVVKRGDKPPKYYIGQASILRKRRDVHFRTLRLGTHKNERLQRAFAKYGREAFSFEVLLVCERQTTIMDSYEKAVLDSYDISLLYNMSLLCVGSRLGVSMRDETKAKIGSGNKGKVRSLEGREAVRKAHTGRVHSAETLAKRSASLMGNKNSLGHKQSAEHREKVGASSRGKKRPPELMARILATRKANAEARGFWKNPEAVARTAQTNRGRKASESTRAKMSASHTRRHQSLENDSDKRWGQAGGGASSDF